MADVRPGSRRPRSAGRLLLTVLVLSGSLTAAACTNAGPTAEPPAGASTAGPARDTAPSPSAARSGSGHGPKGDDAPGSAPAGSRGSTPAGSEGRRAPAAPAAPTGSHRCTAAALDLSLGRVSPGAGNLYAPVVLTNTGSAACTLTGFPGVSLLDSAGRMIGDPATRSGPRHGPVVLGPHRSAYASLHTVNKGVSDKPCREPAAQVRVYPPDSRESLRTPARSFQVCGEVFEVSSVEAGSQP